MILCGPRKAPKAPISFQSPAPKPRAITKGNNTPSARPAPSRAALAPGHPQPKVFTVNPTSKAGMVNQLGIRRERQSSHPAQHAKPSALVDTAISKLAAVSIYPLRHAHELRPALLVRTFAVVRTSCRWLSRFATTRAPQPAALPDAVLSALASLQIEASSRTSSAKCQVVGRGSGSL